MSFARIAVVFLASAAIIACASVTDRVRADFAPWMESEAHGVRLAVPVGFVRRVEGRFVFFRPAGRDDELPYVAVGVPAGRAQPAPEDFLAALLPRPHDPELKLARVEAELDGRLAPGAETWEEGVHGWTYALSRPGGSPAALSIAVPAHWRVERAEAFRRVVCESVRVALRKEAP